MESDGSRRYMSEGRTVKLFLSGDVMIGRGIDQILPCPSEPTLHEEFMENALGYVELAEAASGPIPRRVTPSYIWGEALDILERKSPDARIINLETSVTSSGRWVPKGINYRMSPENVSCLSIARIDCCALANNHILDWGEEGLLETIHTLHNTGIRSAGAGATLYDAKKPAVIESSRDLVGKPSGKGRVLVFAFGMASSGVPPEWAAGPMRPGVDFLPDLRPRSIREIQAQVAAVRQPEDLVVASIHWGPNWGMKISRDDRHFAHALIDEAGVDVVHGHSSHHIKGLEIYRGKLILYGCGDLINDYEGISGHEDFHGDLSLLYFADFERGSGKLSGLELVPVRMRRFQLVRASPEEAGWLHRALNRAGEELGTKFLLGPDQEIRLGFPKLQSSELQRPQLQR